MAKLANLAIRTPSSSESGSLATTSEHEMSRVGRGTTAPGTSTEAETGADNVEGPLMVARGSTTGVNKFRCASKLERILSTASPSSCILVQVVAAPPAELFRRPNCCATAEGGGGIARVAALRRLLREVLVLLLCELCDEEAAAEFPKAAAAAAAL